MLACHRWSKPTASGGVPTSRQAMQGRLRPDELVLVLVECGLMLVWGDQSLCVVEEEKYHPQARCPAGNSNSQSAVTVRQHCSLLPLTTCFCTTPAVTGGVMHRFLGDYASRTARTLDRPHLPLLSCCLLLPASCFLLSWIAYNTVRIMHLFLRCDGPTCRLSVIPFCLARPLPWPTSVISAVSRHQVFNLWPHPGSNSQHAGSEAAVVPWLLPGPCLRQHALIRPHTHSQG